MMVIVLVGPTCSGKSTLEDALVKRGCTKAVSHTTRAPRAGEVNGEAYHFVTPAEFDLLWKNGHFVEMVSFGGNGYAMSADELLKARAINEPIIVVAEPEGAMQIDRFCTRAEVPCVKVWVDCGPNVRAKRFISRMLQDAVAGKEVAGPYAARLGVMLDQEQRWSRSMIYDRVILTDERTPDECAGHLLKMIA